jgi:hypothetical protein
MLNWFKQEPDVRYERDVLDVGQIEGVKPIETAQKELAAAVPVATAPAPGHQHR